MTEKLMIAVYGAASETVADVHKDNAYKIGQIIADSNMSVIFGGGSTGMMGAAARGVRAADGELVGVIPMFMNAIEPEFDDCTKYVYVDSMAERKSVMEALASHFVILPGGIGTMDEMFQIATLIMLGRKKSKIIVFNDNGVYDHIKEYVDDAISRGFIDPKIKDIMIWCNSVNAMTNVIKSLT